MFNIQTYNKISPKRLNRLPADQFKVSETIENPDAIIVRSFKLHDLELPTSLKAIGRAGAGVNNIPVDKCTQKGIVVFNSPGANANAVKELVLAGLLLASRDIIGGVAYSQTLKGKGSEVGPLVEKNKGQYGGIEIKEKTLGIIGLGAIGVMVANDAVALGMQVLGYDPYLSIGNACGLSNQVKLVANMEKLLSQCDFISLHVPLTDSTKGSFDNKRFASLKKGVIVLNFSRAEVVNDGALLEALKSGHVAKYVTDFPSEIHLDNPKIIPMPHLGASTEEAEDNCAVMVADQIKDFLVNGNIVNSVNFPAVAIDRSGAQRITIIGENKADLVAHITTCCAENNIKIVDMVNKTHKTISYSIIDAESAPSKPALEKLGKLSGVINVRVL